MGYVPKIELDKSDAVREGTKVFQLLDFLREQNITCADMIDAAIESETNFKERIAALIRAEGEIDANIVGLKAYIKTMGERVATFEKGKAGIRTAIEEAFDRANVPKIATAFGTVYTTAKPLGVEIVAEADIPTDYFVRKLDATKVNKVARDIGKRRLELASTFIDGEEVALILALWKFDEENPQIPGVEVDREVTYGVTVRRA